ncbi:hypothetical protein K461DRAFT_309159 [Myriangium duriaei CBS 260.36]|uniref:F-box domain-containing protein n=1 Tax=Myriangium duriaei CBS 260.36 TaxID=1168546 RepID=A0A9P4MJB0_9PEZI|nr:hypothetical protein K461DRAFT_309159 [Myriangium duriaei CBS 260.36]
MPTPTFTLSLHPQTQSPLFRLPPELRHQIWSYLLPPMAAISSTTASSNPTLHPTLARTSQRLHYELTPLLYDRPFTAHETLLTALPYYLTRSRPVPEHMARLYSDRWILHVRLDTDPRWTRGQVKEAFDGVRELRVECGQAQYGGCGKENAELLGVVRGVGRVVVHGVGEWGMVLGKVMEGEEGSGMGEVEGSEGDLWEEGYGAGYQVGWSRGLEEGRGLRVQA